jgi:hypothetical protein
MLVKPCLLDWWPSGLWHLTLNQAMKNQRGFESHPILQMFDKLRWFIQPNQPALTSEIVGRFYFTCLFDTLSVRKIDYQLDFVKRSNRTQALILYFASKPDDPRLTIDLNQTLTELLFKFDELMLLFDHNVNKMQIESQKRGYSVEVKGKLAAFLEHGELPKWANDPIAAKLKYTSSDS